MSKSVPSSLNSGPEAQDLEDTITVIPDVHGSQPNPIKKPYLVILDGPNLGQLYALNLCNHVGRHPSMDLCVGDGGVSGQHCQIKASPTQFIIKDLGSRNGTYVNGHLVLEQGLKEGDRISIGRSTVLKFTYLDEQEVLFSLKIADLIDRDSLTGAYSKRCLSTLIERELHYSQAQHKPFSLFMLDLDHFKRVNDQFGHLAGDQVLIQFAAEIKAQIRDQDWFVRYGGEEFVVVAHGVDYIQGVRVADRLRRAIETLDIVYAGQKIPITVSIGIASFPETGVSTVAELLHWADNALYQAKAHGRNCVELATHDSIPVLTVPD